MSEEVKWDCLTCTYRNFLASRKCVMCGAVRPSIVSQDLDNAEQDIYKVAELDATRNNQSAASSALIKSSSSADHQWSCKHCTFINKAWVKKCAECKMHKAFPTVPHSDEIVDKQGGLFDKSSKSAVVKKPLKLSSAVACGLPNIFKWACQMCTFENQPKASHCNMCKTPKDKHHSKQSGCQIICPTSSGNISSNLQLEIDVNTKNQENKRSDENSPHSVTSNQSQQNSPNQPKKSDNNRFSPGSKQSSNENSPKQSPVGQSSPQSNRSSPTNNTNINQDSIIPYNSGSGQRSPNQASPKNNRSGHSSPQEQLSGQISPINNKRGSPLVARASKSNRNLNQARVRGDHTLLIQDSAGAIGGYRVEEDKREKKLQKLRKRLTTEDILWLNACECVVTGDLAGIEHYLTSGGDPTRQLTKDEGLLLDRPSAFEVGYTLVHLALRFRRDDMVAVLLAATDIASKGFKRLPSYVCPDLSADIRREISMMMQQKKKGTFPCFFLTEFSTFTLPADIEDLPRQIQSQLFDEILDNDVEKEKYGSRLYALWNRTAGDCLLDSVLQATWGILDIDNTLRRALADSLLEGANSFYPQWKEYESRQADLLNFSLDESQWQRDWTVLLSLASQPGASLEKLHIFALAHILRRPIIVYGVKVVKSFRGESIDFARFQGVYLPFLWERSFCSKVPIALGYTRGHFSALVPMEMDTDVPLGAGAHIDNAVDEQLFYLPLMDHEGAFLPVHFVCTAESSQEEMLFRRWFDCYVTPDGHFVAMQKVGQSPVLVKQMLEMWVDHYRQQAVPGNENTIIAQGYSTDGESDQDDQTPHKTGSASDLRL
ncbi:ZRAN1-like protein, partial [Mya arenaria]